MAMPSVTSIQGVSAVMPPKAEPLLLAAEL
jgi:hypothetical protein